MRCAQDLTRFTCSAARPLRIQNLRKPKNQNLLRSAGAHDRNRTGDLVLTKDVLYRLSYVGKILNISAALHASDHHTRTGAGDGNRTHTISLEG